MSTDKSGNAFSGYVVTDQEIEKQEIAGQDPGILTYTLHLPTKTVEVRWPTDAEWITRQRARKVVVKQLGQGKTDTKQVPSTDADLALYNQIRMPQSPDIDEYEAEFLINILAMVTVLDVMRSGNEYTVSIAVPGGERTYTLAIPSIRQAKFYEDARIKIHPARYATQVFEVRLEPAAELFDKLFVHPPVSVNSQPSAPSESASQVPIIHKASVVDALIEDIRGTVEGRGEGGGDATAPASNSSRSSSPSSSF